MNNVLVRTVWIALLLLAVIAPFAGLAPLMLVLLIGGMGWALKSLVQVLLFGEDERESNSSSSKSEPLEE